MITFRPDIVAADLPSTVETALFVGVRGEPPLESTQLRWQVKLSSNDVVQLESGPYLEQLGGALFLTTKEPAPETPQGAPPASIGWIKWIAERGRHSFQIQLAISRVGFDRICTLAERGRYPNAILTFMDDSPIEPGLSPNGEKKVWRNVESSFATLKEFTLKYDFTPFA